MKKKSRSWSGPGSRWGSRPWLISWAAVVIIERAAWRKIWLSRTTGATPEAIRSSNGLPAPIGGSWSASPTRTTWVVSARPSSRTSISRRLSIEDSSTITRSTGSGWPGRKAASRPGIHSSRRWIVFASWPVASSSRRAARPVGAQRATVAFGRFGLGDDLPGADGLADAGAAGEDRDPRREGAADRRPLLVGEVVAAARSPGSWSRWGGAAARCAQGRRDGELGGVGRLAVDAALVEQQARARRPARRGRAASPSSRAVRARQLLQRQVGVALLLGLGERVDGRRLGAPARLGRDVGGERDLVGAGEADAVDLGQPVGVLVQDRHRALAVAGRGSAPPGGRARAARAARGGRGRRGWRASFRSPPRPGRR